MIRLWIALSLVGAGMGTELVSVASTVEPESVGPHSEEEAQFLIRDSREAFDGGRVEDSARLLKRLIARYPAHPEMAKSRLLLGRALIALGRPKEAVPHLQRAIEAWGNQPDGVIARLPLGRAYLAAKDPRAALITVSELTKGPAGKKAGTEVMVGGLLIQTHAHLALGKKAEVRRDLHSLNVAATQADAAGQPLPELIRAEMAWIELRFKADDCALLPAQGQMDEGQARIQIERRGSCVEEAARLALRAADLDVDTWAPRAAATLNESLQGLDRACRNPPSPPGKRTTAQLKKYRAELVHFLEPVCARARSGARAAIPEEHMLRKVF